MVSRRWSITVVSVLALAVAFAGCAKRPATSAVAAPAPTGAASSTAGTTDGTGSTATAMGTSPGAATVAPSAGLQPGGGTPGGSAPVAGTPSGAAVGPRPIPKEFAAIPELSDIHFDFDKYDIRAGDAIILDANASWLKSNTDQLVLIEGHCDERGTNEYNLALGERRAKAAMNYLVSLGVQANRITIISYGEERPLCTDHNEACWSKNRRAHFLVKPR